MAVCDRKFGVEIECFVPVSMFEVGAALTTAGIPVHVHGGLTHAVMTKWKIVTDGSLTGMSGHFPMEIVSPVLSGEDGAEQVRKVCKVLNDLGAKVNSGCGLHVHVDARDLSLFQLKNVCKMFAKYELALDSIQPGSRRHNGYCGSNLARWGGNLDAAFAKIDAANSQTALSNLNGTRYVKLNLESLSLYGTVEFRLHSGTTDAKKINGWIGLVTGFVQRAATTRRVEKEGANKLDNVIRFAPGNMRKFYRKRAEQFAAGTTRTTTTGEE
jgi:hypothetical protein